MPIEIKSRWENKVLYTAQSATDVRSALLEAVRDRAYLGDAYLRGADLRGADLGGAYLGDAYLRGADLGDAYLRGADLRGADLRGADLRGARGMNKHLTTPLYLLLDQPGKICAYKLVDSNNQSPIQRSGQLTYAVGETVSVPDANTDEFDYCAAGINVATLDWCMKEWRQGYKILVVEFEAKDIAPFPLARTESSGCTNARSSVKRI